MIFRFFIPELWDLNYYSVLFQHKYCINVPIHVYDAAVGEIQIFHSRVVVAMFANRSGRNEQSS
jgi:hypothetical protein